jgi:hypothetical protein
MPQPARDLMPFHGRANPLGDDQPDTRTAPLATIVAALKVHDDVGLRHTRPVLHRRVKLC